MGPGMGGLYKADNATFIRIESEQEIERGRGKDKRTRENENGIISHKEAQKT
jgi:hypothetical protein